MLNHDQIQAILVMFKLAIGWSAISVSVGAALYILHEMYCRNVNAPDRNLPRPKFDKDGNRITMILRD